MWRFYRFCFILSTFVWISLFCTIMCVEWPITIFKRKLNIKENNCLIISLIKQKGWVAICHRAICRKWSFRHISRFCQKWKSADLQFVDRAYFWQSKWRPASRYRSHTFAHPFLQYCCHCDVKMSTTFSILLCQKYTCWQIASQHFFIFVKIASRQIALWQIATHPKMYN